MDLEALIGLALESGASDLHLEATLPAAVRVRGTLRTVGEPIPANVLADMSRKLLGEAEWGQFLQRCSSDFSRTMQGVRCRFNLLQTSRGIGMVVRLLSSAQVTVESLNLNPELKKLLAHAHGLILVAGPTGSGKSSTLAALLQEINQSETDHIITIESPIEYMFRPRRAYIRQREVGRDTPSFEQALLDALREDPDVLMVGEMREPETMRLTLSASETGHLVLATVHSSTCAEALARVVSAFPSEIQSSVASQLADCLVGVVAQRLIFRPELNLRVPECEILVATHAVKNFIRNRDFFKISSAIETGADHGMWTFQRYRTWLNNRKWPAPDAKPAPIESEPVETGAGGFNLAAWANQAKSAASASPSSEKREPGTFEIEPAEGEFGKILKRPGQP